MPSELSGSAVSAELREQLHQQAVAAEAQQAAIASRQPRLEAQVAAATPQCAPVKRNVTWRIIICNKLT